MRQRYGRERFKQWRNAKGGKWTARITWFHKRDGQTMVDIRLRLETPDGETNVYPATAEEADAMWDAFKADWPRLCDCWHGSNPGRTHPTGFNCPRCGNTGKARKAPSNEAPLANQLRKLRAKEAYERSERDESMG